MSILVSVIVPVYNAEKYLSECLDSILRQSFPHFEVIMVDDGSIDASGQICKLFEENDCRFRYIYQKNQGVSKARQIGVLNARGEWVTFVDADDLLPAWSLSALLDRANGANIICGDVVRFYETVQNVQELRESKVRTITADEYRCRMILGLDSGPFAKLIRRELFRSEVFEMSDKLVMGEDTIANTRLGFINDLPVRFVNQCVYLYRQHQGSCMHTFSPNPEYEKLFVETLYSSVPVDERRKFMPYFIQRRIQTLVFQAQVSAEFQKWQDSLFFRDLLRDVVSFRFKKMVIERLLINTRNSYLRKKLILLMRGKNKLFRFFKR